MRYSLVKRLSAVVVLVACGYPGTLLATQSEGAEPYNGTAFEVYVLANDRPADLVIFDGRSQNFGTDGASRVNQQWQSGKGKLYIETQRRGLDRAEAGVASGEVLLIDESLKAIEWGLQPSVMGPDANFPQQRDTRTAPAHALHPKAEFLEAAARTVILIGQYELAPIDLKARSIALIPNIHRVARRMIDSGDAEAFFSEIDNSNQRAFIATGIFLAGILANDNSTMATANGYMQRILSQQWSNGVYPEKGGQDTSYQMVTVERVMSYLTQIRDPAWRATLMSANTRAVDWFLLRVRQNGSVNTRNNTRTMACGRPIAGTGPKGSGIDKFAIRLYHHGYLMGTLPEIGPVADSIQTYGQDYGHINDCSETDS